MKPVACLTHFSRQKYLNFIDQSAIQWYRDQLLIGSSLPSRLNFNLVNIFGFLDSFIVYLVVFFLSSDLFFLLLFAIP